MLPVITWEIFISANAQLTLLEDNHNSDNKGSGLSAAALDYLRGATMNDVVLSDKRKVMVIYGHHRAANTALFNWLRTIGLEPLEWPQLVRMSGNTSPYIGQVLQQAFDNAQAVLAFFTADEVVTANGGPRGSRNARRVQARPNVLIEAGAALVTHPDRTVLVVLGAQELPSDLGGRDYIRLDGSARPLYELSTRLADAGCAVNPHGSQWLDPGNFPDR
jgi:predicted nucleotide-binding protein